MFTDIVGYTALMGKDEDRAFELLRLNHSIHEVLINKYKGTLIKEIGDGTLIRATSTEQLYKEVQKVLEEYDVVNHLSALERFTSLELTESQFAQLLGHARLYNYLPVEKKKDIPGLYFTDNQVSTVAESYYNDENFSPNGSDSISLWKLYNLFTGANKSSYIDKFLSRGVNAFQLTDHIAEALETGQDRWFLS